VIEASEREYLMLEHELTLAREALRIAIRHMRAATEELRLAHENRRTTFVSFWVAQRAVRLCKEAVRNHQERRPAMRAVDELTRADSCLAKAHPDEPIFVLLARDVLAADIVREWATRAERAGARAEKIAEARALADSMEAYPDRKVPT